MAAFKQAEQTAVEHGIDLSASSALVEHATEHPDEVAGEWGATAFGQRRVGETLVKVDPFTAGRPECVTSSAALGALAGGIDLDDVRTTASVEYDPRVPLGPRDCDTAGPLYGDLRVVVADETVGEEELARIEGPVGHSPVSNLGTPATDCETAIGSTEH